MAPDAERSRSITWDDPKPPLAASRDLDGLAYLRALLAGTYPPPPISRLMNFWIVSADPGEAVFECEPGEYHDNPLGMVHGGLPARCSTRSSAAPRTRPFRRASGYTSIDLNVSYLRPITSASGVIRATGRVVKGGQRVIFAEGVIEDAAGRTLATATSSLLVLKG